MRTIVFLLLLILFSLQYKLWVGDSSVLQWMQLEKKLDEEQAANQQLALRNEAIEADIAELKSGEQALEEQARLELGMIKEGEVYYQFVE